MSYNPFNHGATGANVGPTSAGNKIPKGYRYGQLGMYTPEQKQLFQSLFSHVMPGSYLEKLASGSQEGFAPFEESAKRDYQSALGGLGSRYSGLGSGARGSSAFQLESTQAGQDFATQLAQMRQGLQRQALEDLMGMSEQLLSQRPYEQFLLPKSRKSPSFLKQLGMGLAGGASHLGGLLTGSGLF